MFRRHAVVVAGLVFACPWAAAFAQIASDTTLNEITVTAQKREQSAMDVGATLSVLSAEDLKIRRIEAPEDLANAVPGLTYTRSDYNTPIFSLRGIGFNSAGLANYPAVTFYVDQAPLVFGVLEANQMFDLERIEVLKGPQGTLFGQNSTGGAINLIAAKPTKDFESGVSATYGRFNLEETSGFVSGPPSDTLPGRVAFDQHLMGPWQREYQTGAQN